MATDISEVPIARTGAAMTILDDKMYTWGGYTQEIEGEGDGRFPVNVQLPDEEDEDYPAIEVYSITEHRWRRYKTSGKHDDESNIPAFGFGSVMTGIDGVIYLFGGWNDQEFSNDVFILDPVKMEWEKLQSTGGNPPACKCHGGMVTHQGKLVVFGGIGAAKQGGGAQYITCHDTSVRYEYCWNNELHSFDPKTGQWQEIDCPNRPPPTGAFTFTEIDPDHALLFGGRVEEIRMNHVYILDMRSMVWSGPHLPANEMEPWPTSRTLHTMVPLVDPTLPKAKREQKVLVIWGKGRDNKHVRDMWVLNVPSMTWKELMVATRARMYQMTSAYYRNHDYQTDAIIFGGNIQRKSKNDKNVVTEMRMLKFGVVQSLQGMCRDITSRIYSTNPTTVIQYLPPSLLEQVKERSDQLNADPPCCYDEVFITSKQFEDHPVNLIRNEGQHYSYT